MIGLQRIAPEASSSYGVVALGDELRPGLWRLRDIVEKPAPADAPSSHAALGGYVMAPEIFGCLRDLVAEQPSAEVHLTDAIRRMLERVPVFGVELEGRYLDIGSPVKYLRSHIEFALRDPVGGPELAAFLREVVARDHPPFG